MKIAIISDTHHEFSAQIEQAKVTQEVDVLVLAGDIDTASRVVDRALSIGDGLAKNIVFVCGNHEFYGERMDKARRKIQANLDAYNATGMDVKVHFLDNNYTDIDGYRFIGATLWTNFALYGNPRVAMFDAEQFMNDYRRIKVEKDGVYRRLFAKDILSENLISSQFIWDEIWKRREENLLFKTVVISHHAPDSMSIDDDFIGNSLNPAYANNYGNRLAYEGGPQLWVSGHMHCRKRYICGDTLCIQNPYGYPGQNPWAGITYLDLENLPSEEVINSNSDGWIPERQSS